MDAFATVDDLAGRLNRTFSAGAESDWITLLLGDASTYLRDIIGAQVWPQSQATFTAWPDCGEVRLPQQPAVSVDAVQRDGADVAFVRREDIVLVQGDDPVDVTFTFGYAVVPEGLTRWACVLVSQALLTLEQQLGLTAGGLSSVAIDDFKAAWADAGEFSGITLSDRNVALLREQYGRPESFVVGTR